MKLQALVLAIAAACLAQPVSSQDADASGECLIDARASAPMGDVLATNALSVSGYDALCARLRNANMGVDVVDYAGINGNRMIAIVLVRLYDRASRVNGSLRTAQLMVDADVSEGSRERNLMAAYGAALETIAADPERYVEAVHGEVGRLRVLHRNGVPERMTGATPDCRLNYMNSDEMNVAMRAWDWPGFAGDGALCEVLRPEGAGIALVGGRTIAEGRAVGWVAAGLFDRRTLVDGYAWNFVISTSEITTPDELLNIQREATIAARVNIARDPQALLPYLEEVRAGNGNWFTGPGR